MIQTAITNHIHAHAHQIHALTQDPHHQHARDTTQPLDHHHAQFLIPVLHRARVLDHLLLNDLVDIQGTPTQGHPHIPDLVRDLALVLGLVHDHLHILALVQDLPHALDLGPLMVDDDGMTAIDAQVLYLERLLLII